MKYIVVLPLAKIGIVLIPIFAISVFLLWYYLRKQKRNTPNKVRNDSCKTRIILEEKYPYYQHLNKDEKRIFEKRVLLFIQEKTFLPQKGFELTFEKKVLISASAIQLTFGLKRYLLKPFKHILLFKEAYYSPITGYYHKGDVNMKGAIALSWSDFIQGVKDPHDKINLGLHEMAHALDLSSILLQNRYYYFKSLKEKFEQVAEKEFININNNQSHFFRSYAGANQREFFSVAVEHFFEAPEEFNTHLPELYQEMCLLLNQDPLHGIYRNLNVKHLKIHPNHFNEKASASITEIKNDFGSTPCLVPTIIALFFAEGFIWITNLSVYFYAISGILILIAGILFSLYHIKIYPEYLIFKHPFRNPIIININNIIYINFVNHLVRKSMEISFLTEKGIQEISIPLCLSPRCITKLQRILINLKILIKVENHKIKKAG